MLEAGTYGRIDRRKLVLLSSNPNPNPVLLPWLHIGEI